MTIIDDYKILIDELILKGYDSDYSEGFATGDLHAKCAMLVACAGDADAMTAAMYAMDAESDGELLDLVDVYGTACADTLADGHPPMAAQAYARGKVIAALGKVLLCNNLPPKVTQTVLELTDTQLGWVCGSAAIDPTDCDTCSGIRNGAMQK